MTRAAQRQEVLDAIEYWRPRLLLDHHSIAPVFHYKPRSADEAEGEVTYAETEYGGVGFEATLHIYPEFWKHPPERRRKNVLHELLHVVAQSADETDIIALTEAFWRQSRGEAGRVAARPAATEDIVRNAGS